MDMVAQALPHSRSHVPMSCLPVLEISFHIPHPTPSPCLMCTQGWWSYVWGNHDLIFEALTLLVIPLCFVLFPPRIPPQVARDLVFNWSAWISSQHDTADGGKLSCFACPQPLDVPIDVCRCLGCRMQQPFSTNPAGRKKCPSPSVLNHELSSLNQPKFDIRSKPSPGRGSPSIGLGRAMAKAGVV